MSSDEDSECSIPFEEDADFSEDEKPKIKLYKEDVVLENLWKACRRKTRADLATVEELLNKHGPDIIHRPYRNNLVWYDHVLYKYLDTDLRFLTILLDSEPGDSARLQVRSSCDPFINITFFRKSNIQNAFQNLDVLAVKFEYLLLVLKIWTVRPL